jgi:hypothetical protein
LQLPPVMHSRTQSARSIDGPVVLLLSLLVVVAAACGGTPEAGPGASTPAPPDFPALHDEVCDTLRNSFRCARAIEARQLPADDGVDRKGDTLLLALAAGDTVRLVDRRGDASEVMHYSYQTRWPGAGLMVIQLQYYEGSEYVLVDETTGERTTLPHWPLRAPGGERFAVLSFGLEAGYGPNTLQIWDLSDDGPELQWSVEPEDWGPAEGHWEDDFTLRFVQRQYCDDPTGPGRHMCDRPARVTLEGGLWRVESDG